MNKICWQCRSECDVLASVCPQCKAKLGNRKASGLASKRMSWLAWTGIGCGGLFLLSIIIPMAIATGSVASSVHKAPADDSHEPTAAEISAAESRFNKLRPIFVKDVDKFSDGVLWRHKSFSQYINGNGTTLSADIWNGAIRLQASYQGSEWIFFKDVTVKTSAGLVEAHGRPEHHVQSGVTEYLRISEPEATQMLGLIKSAGDGPVDIRLNGKFYKDFSLKATHKKGIQDTITFLEDLNTLRQAGKLPKGVD